MANYLLIPFLPLAAFLINIIFGRKFIRDKAHWVSVPAVVVSWVISVITLFDVIGGKTLNVDLYTWITSGTFKVSVGFLIDPLTAVMLIVVTTVSSLVHIYSIGYMHGDKGYYRFFSYLSLFTFSMLMLVMANNFLQLYFGWEAVGLCSYFLIGFWYEKKSASDAGKKAFIVNRFGDFGFGLGVIMIFLTMGTLHYAPVFANIKSLVGQTVTVHALGIQFDMITFIALLLFCGAVGKSAQLPLHVWLPDAMEGPTPVSALIHAATMVTAGVFMVARCSPIFNLSPFAMNVVAVVGAVTALFAGTIALVQNDIKRIIAYSTVSQLGYMFLACGVGAYSAGIFHLYTHAFFKALLFLGAGSVMHAMAGELDIQKMGGLKKHLPWTYWTFLLASLSISGVPLLSGFFSKDEILWRAYSSGPLGQILFAIGALTALLTAFYSFRIIYVAFHGEFRGTHEQEHHLHESPKTMTIPLVILAVGAVLAGYVGVSPLIANTFGLKPDAFGEFMAPVLGHAKGEGTHAEEIATMTLSILLGLSGIAFAAFMYLRKTDLPKRLGEVFAWPYKVLWNKYYVDELYDFMVVRPTLWIAKNVIVKVMDGKIIEGTVNGVPRLIGRFSSWLRSIQTGMVHQYAAVMAIGAFFVIAVVLLWR
jgi:NADH-quinone oxidoreductase subunit L